MLLMKIVYILFETIHANMYTLWILFSKLSFFSIYVFNSADNISANNNVISTGERFNDFKAVAVGVFVIKEAF